MRIDPAPFEPLMPAPVRAAVGMEEVAVCGPSAYALASVAEGFRPAGLRVVAGDDPIDLAEPPSDS